MQLIVIQLSIHFQPYSLFNVHHIFRCPSICCNDHCHWLTDSLIKTVDKRAKNGLYSSLASQCLGKAFIDGAGTIWHRTIWRRTIWHRTIWHQTIWHRTILRHGQFGTGQFRTRQFGTRKNLAPGQFNTMGKNWQFGAEKLKILLILIRQCFASLILSK